MRKLLILFLIFMVGSEVRAAEPVRRAQEELRRRNLFYGDVDGKDTPELAAALRLYQTRKGFDSTGKLDPTAAQSLGIAVEGASTSHDTASTKWPDLPVLKSDAARELPASISLESANPMKLFPWILLISLGVSLPGCERARARSAEKSPSESAPVEATWYNVPPDSLARRRAKTAELTAASDRYKLGTLLRVTRVSNGRVVVVRVTDTGLQDDKSQIDLCKEAAAQLEMVSDGVAKVRLTVLSSTLDRAATVTPAP